MKRLSRVCVYLALCSAVFPFAAAAVPANFQNEILITGLTEPTQVAFTPDQRMLIIERAGRIWVVQPGAAQVDATPFNQITNINIANGERGLVGIVLDPSFATNGFYYVFYTANSPLRDRVTRFTASGNATVPGSEVILWQDFATASSYHHGGGLAFGPDGFLYISIGEQDVSPNAQSLTSYAGKILRIASNGAIPTNNPFYDGAGPNLDEIWARGLRNPFRISFDPSNGRMFIDDNGDNDPGSSIEEINIGAAGANYGWPICQGNCGTAGMTNPIYSYPHAGRDASVTGGLMYRGTQFPVEYRGSYFYGDYVQNTIRRLTFDVNGNVTGSVNFEPVDGVADGPYGDIVDIRQGPDGAIYYTDIGLSWEGAAHAAAIRRIRYTAGNQPPIAQAAGNPLQGLAPLTVNFSSAGSSDPESQPLSYAWTFGDGGTSTLANPSHQYTNEGTYNARLSVSDGVNSTLSANVVVVVGNAPTAQITSPANNATFRAGNTITFAGTATDTEDGALPASAFTWNVQFLHDNHTHPFLGPLSNTTGSTFNIDTTGHDYRGFTRYLITLTVTDSDGLQKTTSVTIFPEKVNLSVDSVPSGLNLTFDGITQTTPFLWDTIIGFQHTIAAPHQTSGGQHYNFVSWSDGGLQAHTITVPTQSTSYTATFQSSGPAATPMVAYGFNEGAGSLTADSSGNGRTGTLTNPQWTTSGRYGNGLFFDGTNARVTAPSITLPSTFTLMAWINNPTNQAYESLITIGKDRDLYLQNGTLTLETPVPGTARAFGAIPTNAWHHLAVVSNGTITRAYLNGEPLGADLAAVTDSFAGVLLLGAWNGAGSPVDFFSGTMDEVRVYNVALSQGQIQADMSTLLTADADGDGITDLFETNTGIYVSPTDTGSNPNNPDSDGDGFIDSLELADGTNPNNASSNQPRTDVYIQFGAQPPHMGTLTSPAVTLARVVPMLQANGTVHFLSPGTTNESATITKKMTLRAEGGTVRIGAP